MKRNGLQMSAASLENICTCKECDHDFATDCVGCECCEPGTHSMVMDGMEGFDPKGKEVQVRIPVGSNILLGDLSQPTGNKRGIVLFAHGSGSSRLSTRNRYVAGVLQRAGLGTLLFDLLTEEEERIDEQTGHLRFNIKLLADRLVGVTDWLVNTLDSDENNNNKFRLGYFGASTGAAAALVAAANKRHIVRAIVSRGGRPDLAGEYLEQVTSPTLLIVGGDDKVVIGLNQEALGRLKSLRDDEKKLVIVPGATHLFEEPGTLEQVAQLATRWFALLLDNSKEDHTGKSQRIHVDDNS
jgi:putative phosphoribosyl transferase